MKTTRVAALTFVLAGLAAAQTALPAATSGCDNCGVVVSIEMTTQEEQWSPLGVVAAGPTAGSMATGETRAMYAFGDESSRGMMVVGAAGGAVYSKRPNSYQKPAWDVTVKMDRGGNRVLRQRYEPFVHEGERVRVRGTQLELEE